MPDKNLDAFYLQDSRSNTGTGAMWWAIGGGYTTNIDNAEVFTCKDAVRQYECRETDLPWPKDYIDARHHVGVDCQYVRNEEAALAAGCERRFYAAYHREWNGNDLVWLAKGGAGGTSNLNDAHQFSADHVPGLSARGYQALPATYIDGKSRRLVSVERMNHKVALRGVHLKLKKSKPQKIRAYRYRCEPCGRFLSEYQNYHECPNCGAENRP